MCEVSAGEGEVVAVNEQFLFAEHICTGYIQILERHQRPEEKSSDHIFQGSQTLSEVAILLRSVLWQGTPLD